MSARIIEQNLEKISYFRAAVAAGSLKRAAIEMHITQPALSRAIQTLERNLDQTLLLRTSNGVKPTPEGERLYEFSLRLAHLVLEFGAQSDVPSLLDGRTLTIGSYDSIAVYYLGGLVASLRERFPKVRVEMRVSRTKDLAACLRRDDVDVIIGVNLAREFEAEDAFRIEELFVDQFSFYGARNFPSAAPPLLFVPDARDGTGRTLEDHLSEYGPFEAVRCENFETVKALTLQGLGVGVLPDKVTAPLASLVRRPYRLSQPVTFGAHSIDLAMRSEAAPFQKLFAFIGDHASTWAHGAKDR